MQPSLVRLTAGETPAPHPARIPYRRALAWKPAWEEEDSPMPIFVTQRAYIRLCAYAGSDLENEVGGWLTGKWCRDPQTDQQFIVIEMVIPAQHVNNGAAYITFTPESMLALHDRLQEEDAQKRILGWYHTHPRMGIFFSMWDAWLHNNFFSEPWQVALVMEPHSKSGGFFIRQANGVLDQRRYYGFYELLHRAKKRSVVHWSNLLPAQAPGSAEGEL